MPLRAEETNASNVEAGSDDEARASWTKETKIKMLNLYGKYKEQLAIKEAAGKHNGDKEGEGGPEEFQGQHQSGMGHAAERCSEKGVHTQEVRSGEGEILAD